LKRIGILLLLSGLLLSGAGCGQQTTKDGQSYGSSDSASLTQSGSESSTESVTESADDSADDSDPVILESNTVQPSVMEFSLDNHRPYDTIEEYLQSDSAKEMIRQLTEAEDDDVIHTAVFAEGGTRLVFERQLSKDFNLWLRDDFLENVEEQTESKSKVFVALIDELESCINKKVITVMVRYVDPESNVLYQREFDNDKKPVTEQASRDTSQESQNETGSNGSSESEASSHGAASKTSESAQNSKNN